MNLKQILSTLPSLNEKRNKTFLKGEKTTTGVKVYRLPKVSKKRMAQEAIYKVERKKFLKERVFCQVRRPECLGKASDVHHLYSGSDRDKYFLDKTTWLSVCRSCHKFIHEQPKVAKTLGFLK